MVVAWGIDVGASAVKIVKLSVGKTGSELLAVAFPEKGLTLLVKPTSAIVAHSEFRRR